MSEQCKIKFLLAQAGRVLVFEVYEMDERFRSGKGNPTFKYLASNGITVTSAIFPSLRDDDEVYLRGEDAARDKECSIVTFDTVQEAKVYHIRVLEAIKEWANNWEGWNYPVEATKPNPSNVYTF